VPSFELDLFGRVQALSDAAAAQVLRNGLELMGVSAPERLERPAEASA